MKRDVAQKLRAFQAIVTIFNESQSAIVFAIKIMAITTATVMNFFGLGYFHVNWLVGFFCFACAVNAEIAFLALFDHAFSIPVKADYVRKVALLRMGTSSNNEHNNGKRRLLTRELRSFPVLGIKVGRFNYLERDSTPNFLNFVANKTATLLVMFQ